MSQTNTYGAIVVAATMALASAPYEVPVKVAEVQRQSSRSWMEYARFNNKSGAFMIFDSHASENYYRTHNTDRLIDHVSIEMQTRYQSLKRSFIHYSEGFPKEKMNHFAIMANALCKLEFRDNVSSYNKVDESIDTVLKLKNGLILSISSFVEDSEDAPMVFSLHRGQTLLVSDELPVNEIVRTINSVIA